MREKQDFSQILFFNSISSSQNEKYIPLWINQLNFLGLSPFIETVLLYFRCLISTKLAIPGEIIVFKMIPEIGNSPCHATSFPNTASEDSLLI